MAKIKKITRPEKLKLRKKILIVDQDPSFRKTLENIFSADFEVHLATNGQEALKDFSSIAPDLVVTELIMPKLDGFVLIHEINKVAKIPIIVTSTAMVNSSHDYLVELGVCGFLSKNKPELALEKASQVLADPAAAQVTWRKQR